jgi:large subunit ribosomal protein L15
LEIHPESCSVEYLKRVLLPKPTMASKLPPRLLPQFTKHTRRRPTCLNSTTSVVPSPLSSRTRHASNYSPISTSEMEVDGASRPRWQYTPPLMKAPIPSRVKTPGNEIKVNSDPAKLDQVYIRMLGKDGDKLLSEEVKWLAVTHKSFDHGRRGFNDRLAYLGESWNSPRGWVQCG